MANAAVEIKKLSYQYKGQERLCLDNLSLQVKAGERFGLFGPNGAGKTTLMSLLTGVLRSPNGDINIMGHPIAEKHSVNKLIGFVPQDFSFYEELTPLENLEFFGAWSGLSRKVVTERSGELLEVLGLFASRNKQVRRFSGGMKRRVNLAIGVIHRPKVLFLDEPTVGVDVQTRHAIINYLKELNQNGTTLIYTSHHLKEAEELCEKIALIDEGKIIAVNSLPEMLKQFGEGGLEGLFLKLTGKNYRDL